MNTAIVISKLLANDAYYISHLDLRQNPLGNEGIKVLANGIMQSNSLVHLDLRSTSFRKEAASRLFKALEDNETITCLKLGNFRGINRNILNGNALVGITRYLKKTLVLTFLDLKGAAIGTQGLRYVLNGVLLCKQIRVLNIAFNNLNATSYSLLIDLMTVTTLKQLDISENPLGDGFLTEFLDVKESITLKYLAMSSCEFTNASGLFNMIKKGVSLEHVEIDCVKYDDQGFTQLSSYLSNTSLLISLSKANCLLGDYGIEIATRGVSNNYTLEEINISGNKITNHGAISFCKNISCMKNRILKSLNVSHNFIEVIKNLNP